MAQPAFHTVQNSMKCKDNGIYLIFNWHQPPMCKGGLGTTAHVTCVLGHEVVPLKCCT